MQMAQGWMRSWAGSFGLRGKEADAASARGISMEYNKFFFTLKGKSFF